MNMPRNVTLATV